MAGGLRHLCGECLGGVPPSQFARDSRQHKRMGYREFGIIPGHTVGADGQRHDNVCLDRELPLS